MAWGEEVTNDPIFDVAAEVIRKTSRERPADAVLREMLHGRKDLTRSSGRGISRMVFHYYRWLGWLDTAKPLEDQLAQARDLAKRLRIFPDSFSDDELLKAIPSWAAEQVEVSPGWLRALQAEPALWLRARHGYADEVIAHLPTSQPGPLPDSIFYSGELDLFLTPDFHDGLFELQDVNSQAVGWICNPQPSQTWWDACAGEGGKTLHLSNLMENKGLIWATDKAEWRLKQLKLRAKRAQCFNYRTKAWPDTNVLPTKTRFDGVLVDAPCSGIGTWTRNPHARWTTTAQDVAELAAIQQNILSQAATRVKSGGRLIYSVCTLSRAETAGIADAFEAAHTEFAPSPFADPFHPQEPPVSRLTFWPQTARGNGMFIAAWTRRA